MAANVTYKSLDGVPGLYFDCPCGLGTLSDSACGRLYKEAMSPVGLKEGRRITCRACPVGACHAGVSLKVASTSRFLGSCVCARCHGDAARLIRGSICVSCYNREREVLIGRNGRGGKPVFGKPIGMTVMAVLFDSGKTIQVRRIEKITSQMEVVLAIVRSEPKTVWFGWVGQPPLKGARDARSVV